VAIDISDLPGTVAGRADEDILADADSYEGGTDSLLDGMFQEMCDRFDAEAAAGNTAEVGYEVIAPDGSRHYTLSIDNGACSFSRTEAASPKLATSVHLVDFLRIGANEIEPPEAFFSGRMQLKGDLMFARKMTQWFPEN
jgi:putative sterol carrier protein